MSAARFTVPLPEEAGGGATEVRVDPAARAERGLVLLAHGAGTHAAHPTMVALSTALARAGLASARFDFAYRTRRTGPPDRMPRLVACYRAVAEATRARLEPARLLLGGHSMGSRAAAHLQAEGFQADGLLLLAYPLHPPRRPEATRDAVLRSLTVPTLWIAGTRDPFCTPAVDARVRRELGEQVRCVRIEGADHAYDVRRSSGRTREDVLAEVTAVVARWLPDSAA